MLNDYDVFNNHILPLWKISLRNSTIKVAVWYTANLFRGKPTLPDNNKIFPILELSKDILKNHPSEIELIRDSIWAIG